MYAVRVMKYSVIIISSSSTENCILKMTISCVMIYKWVSLRTYTVRLMNYFVVIITV